MVVRVPIALLSSLIIRPIKNIDKTILSSVLKATIHSLQVRSLRPILPQLASPTLATLPFLVPYIPQQPSLILHNSICCHFHKPLICLLQQDQSFKAFCTFLTENFLKLKVEAVYKENIIDRLLKNVNDKPLKEQKEVSKMLQTTQSMP